LEPADTWIIVMRMVVGKNFSKSGRKYVKPVLPFESFITRSMPWMPIVQSMAVFCHHEVIESSCS
jgi:hypothetical protein